MNFHVGPAKNKFYDLEIYLQETYFPHLQSKDKETHPTRLTRMLRD